MFSSSDRIVMNNSRVHLYSGSAEVLAKVILLDRDALSAGEECFAQLRLEEPMALRRGDKFIIRFYSPIITVGGGSILDTLPLKHKRNREEVLAGMEILAGGSTEDIIAAKSGEHRFVRQEELAHELGLLPDEMEKFIAGMTADEGGESPLVRLPDRTLLSRAKYEKMKSGLEDIINVYHDANPLADGIPRQELLSRLRETWHSEDDKLIQGAIKHLMDNGVIEDHGKSIALSGFRIEYTPEQLRLKNRIAKMYAEAGLEMVRTDDIMALDKNKGVISAILGDLTEEGLIIKVNPSYYISTEAWGEVLRAANSFEGPFTLAEFRDCIGTSRKYAAEFLPALDKAGITVFDGTSRTVVRK
jgi:selenocysteine-specific elongation factor